MQGLPLTRLVSRLSQHRSAGQLRAFQPALRVPIPNSGLPDFTYRALLVDAAGTLLVPSEPAAEVYLRYGSKYGVKLPASEILSRFRRAYNSPWTLTSQRYVGDGKPFWQNIVTQSTGCDSLLLFEEVYGYYAQAAAWYVAPGAHAALQRLKDSGLKLGIVSNFDTRLRPILKGLGLDQLFDTIVISAEIGVEKPNPIIFEAACQELGVLPEEAVHVGDDRRNDIFGARDAGCFAWLWGMDVLTFDEVSRKMLHEEEHDDPDSDAILSPIS